MVVLLGAGRGVRGPDVHLHGDLLGLRRHRDRPLRRPEHLGVWVVRALRPVAAARAGRRRRPGPSRSRPGRCSARVPCRGGPGPRGRDPGAHAGPGARSCSAGPLGVVWRTSTTHVRSGYKVLRGTIGLPRPLRRASRPSTRVSTRPSPREPRSWPRSTTPPCSASRATNSPRSTWPAACPPRRTCRTSPARRPRCDYLRHLGLRLHRRRLQDRARPLPVQGVAERPPLAALQLPGLGPVLPRLDELGHDPRTHRRGAVRYFGSLVAHPDRPCVGPGSSTPAVSERPGRKRGGQKIPATRPAAKVAPSSAARSRSPGPISPTTVTGGRTRRHRRPVAIRSTLATAPSTSVSPFTTRHVGEAGGRVQTRVVDALEEVLDRPGHVPEVGRRDEQHAVRPQHVVGGRREARRGPGSPGRLRRRRSPPPPPRRTAPGSIPSENGRRPGDGDGSRDPRPVPSPVSCRAPQRRS